MLKRCLLAASCLLAFAVFPSHALADDLLVDWSSLVPALTDDYDPNSSNICNSGDIRCVDSVVAEMSKRFAPLASSCDHNALFALLYLRVTQTYRSMVGADPNFFSDNRFVNHEDPVFASYYFKSFDNYQRGDLADVPQAWQIAYNAARNRSVSGDGDLLLGVNAHVQRDLPFVLYRIGLVKPDGTSRKPDHDKVNQILYAAYGPALTESAKRFDPSVDPSLPINLPPAVSGTASSLGNQTLFNIVEAWREIAWRNAERLAAAADDGSYAAVAQDIENYAASQAQLIYDSTANVPPVTTSASRDAYCAINHG